MIGDLTTVADVQNWLAQQGQAPTDPQGVIASLVTSVSQATLAFLQRAPFASAPYSETFDGRRTRTRFLKQWPVTSITSVMIDGRVIPQSSSPLTPGWVLQPWDGYPPGQVQALELRGSYMFDRGHSNCAIVYTAGYLVQAEAHVVPTGGGNVSVVQPYGAWIADGGVTYANGTPLAPVTGPPAAGQYQLGAQPGDYVFAAADQGQAVLNTYSYVPYPVAAAVKEWCAERYRYRSRIGEKSQSQGGQTTASYDIKDIPEFVTTQLNPYRRVLPVSV